MDETRTAAADVTEAEVRAAIASQVCPWCGAGPFAMLPVHTNKIHDVDKWKLRDLAGLSVNDPLCTPESRQKMREAAIRNDSVAYIAGRSGPRGPKKHATRAGRERNASTLKTWTVEHPDEAARQRSVAGRAGAAARWGTDG